MSNECKNYIHKYKCDTYNENHAACKNCEMGVGSPIVFTITPSDLGYSIRTQDSRSEEPYNNIYCGELSAIMTEISKKYNDKGFAVLFKVD